MIHFEHGWSSFGLGFRVTRYLGGWVLVCMIGQIDVSYERVRK